MEFTDEKIGGKLLESITGGLYDGNQNCVREYVQNSIDSGAKNIKIYHELGNSNLIIRDDGSGMTNEELRSALNIGTSEKIGGNIGWRGIGIWSGVPASKELVIITKAKGKEKLRIKIDNEKLRIGSETNKPILDILTESTGEIEELPIGKSESINDHYTDIRLENILITQKHIFSEKQLRNYLQLVIPAPFDERNFSYSAEINEWLKQNGVILPEVNIELDGKKIYRPPYETDTYIGAVVKHPFYDENDNLIAVSWFLSLKINQKLDWPAAGILFKKKGFTIGDENLVRSYFAKTYRQWHYGEIHIVSDKIRENAPRNNFEYNHGNIVEFMNNMENFIQSLEEINQYKSSKMDVEGTQKIENMVNKGDIEAVEEKIKKKIAKFSKSSRSFPKEIYFEPLKKSIDEIAEQNMTKLLNFDKMSGDEQTKSATDVKDQSSKLSRIIKDESLKSDEMIKKDLEETLKIKRSDLNGMIDAFLPKSAANDLKKLNKGGKLDIEIASTDILRRILQEKTGLRSNEIQELSRAAFGWGDIPRKGKPLLLFDKNTPTRDLRLGVLIYAIYDIFVNKYKHDRGSGRFRWFDDATEDEKLKIIYGHIAIICLIYRLIESCEKSKP